MSKSILIVEDEETLRESIKRIFTKEGYAVEGAESAEKGWSCWARTVYDVIISDIILPGMDGIEMLTKVREQIPDQIVIVVTAYASLDTSVKALRAGAYDYIMKPIIHEEIKQIVRNALRQKSLQTENVLLKREIGKDYDFSSIIGESAGAQDHLDEVKKVTDTKSSVLLLGETGTGKELFARVIHHNSSRRDMPFVPINCSAIPENLLETELFGHVRGAFTGAVATKKGILEDAEGGTVFLDEIGDMSLALQAKLLRVIEDQVIRPVGSTKGTKVDIRFITATNKDLKSAVKTERVPRGPLLPHQCHLAPDPAAPGTEGRHPRRWCSTTWQICPGDGQAGQGALPRSHGSHDELRVGRERARAPERHRAGHPHFRRRRHQAGASARRRDGRDRRSSSSPSTRSFRSRTTPRPSSCATRPSSTNSSSPIMLGITRKSLWEKRKKWGIPKERQVT